MPEVVALGPLFETHPDPMWVFDAASLELLEVNATAETVFGYSRATFLTMTIADLRAPEDRPALEQALQSRGSGYHPAGIWQLRRSDGSWLTADIRWHPIEFRGRDAILASIRDISELPELQRERELRNANLRLQEQETNLRMSQRLLGVGIWRLHLETGAVSWSDNIYSMLGVEPATFAHDFDAYAELLHPDDRPRLRRVFRAVIDGRQSTLDFEHRVVRSDGEIVHLRGVGEVTATAQGRMLTGVVQDVTLQVREQAERLAAANMMRIAGNAARLGGWRLDMAQGMVEWSPVTAELHDLSAPGMLAIEAASSFYPPEYRARLEAAISRCIRNRESFDEVLALETAHGRQIWARIIGEPVAGPEGQVIAVEGAFQDVTELVEARDRSERLSLRLVETLESISDAFFTLDREWRFTYLNNRAEALLQRRREKLIGENVWEHFPAAVGTTFEQQYRHVLAHGETARFTEYYPEPLDTWFEVSAYPAPDGVAVYFRDVTGERARREQLRLLEAAVARQNDVLLITEAHAIDAPDGPRIVYVNDAFERRTGYRREEVIGRTPRLLQGPDTDREELDRIRAALEEWRPVRAELINYTRDGTPYRVELDIVPLSNEQGDYTHWVAVERDVTEQRELGERLRQAQKLEAVGQLTGGVAHDFNNLLTVILGNAEMLSETLAGQHNLKSLADLTVSAAERGAELTSRLLAFARRQALEPRIVDLNRLVADMDRLLRRTLTENIEIELVRGGGLWRTEVDPSQLEAALLNLAINARDAMEAGGRLTIETANAHLDDGYVNGLEDVSPGQYVMITVSDTGTGMPAGVAAQAFEPFFTTKEVGKGSGLGLSMVYGFVKQSGGHARIYTEQGHGTTVRLYFPRADERSLAAVRGPAAEPARGGPEVILVVEDDALVREHLIAQLRSLGYQVVGAADGHAAIHAMDELGGLDLLLTDVVMPGGINGRELAERARAVRPGLRVLFTSGYTENAIVHHGRLDRGVHLLSKPYRRQELAAKVRKVLDGPTG